MPRVLVFGTATAIMIGGVVNEMPLPVLAVFAAFWVIALGLLVKATQGITGEGSMSVDGDAGGGSDGDSDGGSDGGGGDGGGE